MLDADILCRCSCRDGSYMATEKLTRKKWYGEVRQRRFSRRDVGIAPYDLL